MSSVLVGVSDLDRSLDLFHRLMGLRIEHQGGLDSEHRQRWAIPDGVAARLVEMSCAGYPVGRLTLVSWEPPVVDRVRPDVPPFDMAHDIGPKAIDFYVRDPIRPRFDELVAWGCEARSEPVRWQLSRFDSEEVVLFGPDGVPMLLMVGHRHPKSSQRAEFEGDYSEIATTSVISDDLDDSRGFYVDVLGMDMSGDDAVTSSSAEDASRLLGVGSGTEMRLMLFQAFGEQSGKYLLVHFPSVSGRRLAGRMRPGMLGVSLFIHATDDLDGIHGRAHKHGAELVRPPTEIGDGRRSMLLRGPNEELFELVEQE